MKLLNATMMMNPWGLLAAAIVGVGVALAGFIKKQREVSLAERTISDIRSEAARQVGEETARLNILIKTAENEKLSLDKRKEAIKQLNQIIPNYNAQLDETTGEYRANKAALDAYLVSLAKQYEIEGARGKLKELGERKAELSLKRADAQQAVEAAEANSRNAASASGNFNYATTQGGGAPAVVSMQASASSELAGTRKKLKGINDELKEIEKTEKAIAQKAVEQAANANTTSADSALAVADEEEAVPFEYVPFEGESTSNITSVVKVKTRIKTKNILVKLIANKIMKKVDDLSDLFSSDEDVAAYNIDNMIDTFNQLQQSLLGEEFIDFGDL
jgi:hypothetical protein